MSHPKIPTLSMNNQEKTTRFRLNLFKSQYTCETMSRTPGWPQNLNQPGLLDLFSDEDLKMDYLRRYYPKIPKFNGKNQEKLRILGWICSSLNIHVKQQPGSHLDPKILTNPVYWPYSVMRTIRWTICECPIQKFQNLMGKIRKSYAF